MAKRKIGLGRGLNALLRDTEPAEPNEAEKGVVYLNTETVNQNQRQPRKLFKDEPLDDLVRSVTERGVLQPLLVRKAGNHYELIAGERRLRAARAAKLERVPVLVMELGDQEALEVALVENLQREDLNPIEEAAGYQTLIEEFELTQEQIAERLGKARATIANALRLLGLPEIVQTSVAEGLLTAGHAKVLLGLEIPKEQALLAEEVVRAGLSVRDLEKRVQKIKRPPKKPRVARIDIPESHLNYLTDQLHQHLSTPVFITPSRTLANGKKTRGKIEIHYFTNEDLDRLLSLLGISGDGP